MAGTAAQPCGNRSLYVLTMLLLGILGAAAIVCAAEMLLENTRMLAVSAYRLPPPDGQTQKNRRIVQISDLHHKRFGTHQYRLVAEVQKLSPDYIVITGDLVSRDMTDFAETADLLSALRKLAPIVMSLGNHELDLPEAVFRDLMALLRRMDVVVLDDAWKEIDGMRFAGLTLTPRHYKNGDSYRGLSDCTEADIRHILGEAKTGTILLAHNPLFFAAYAEWGAAVVLSGHVHGGVIRLPLAGGLLSPERKFFPKYDKGFFRAANGAMMVVSGGLGKLRLWNPPELCVMDFAADGQEIPHFPRNLYKNHRRIFRHSTGNAKDMADA